jgi:hypothetical protein
LGPICAIAIPERFLHCQICTLSHLPFALLHEFMHDKAGKGVGDLKSLDILLKFVLHDCIRNLN